MIARRASASMLRVACVPMVALLLAACAGNPSKPPSPTTQTTSTAHARPARKPWKPLGPYTPGGLYAPGVSDGAPDIPPDVANLPEPVPHAEPLSRYGNRSPYVVLGKTYTVLPTANGYVERGIASWYGTKFDGRATSNFEPYDLYQFTAAHRTLPLPSYARVTNLDNGRSVIVRINDRGPFHEGRLIDLSYAAAVKLGVNVHGTAPVEVRGIDPGERLPGTTTAARSAVMAGAVEAPRSKTPATIDLLPKAVVATPAAAKTIAPGPSPSGPVPSGPVPPAAIKPTPVGFTPMKPAPVTPAAVEPAPVEPASSGPAPVMAAAASQKLPTIAHSAEPVAPQSAASVSKPASSVLPSASTTAAGSPSIATTPAALAPVASPPAVPTSVAPTVAAQPATIMTGESPATTMTQPLIGHPVIEPSTIGFLQVASYSDRGNAEHMLQRLQQAGVEHAELIPVQVADQTMWRVHIGPLRADDADSVARQLDALGFGIPPFFKE